MTQILQNPVVMIVVVLSFSNIAASFSLEQSLGLVQYSVW